MPGWFGPVREGLDPSTGLGSGHPVALFRCANAKLKCGCVPYGTECGPGCRCWVRIMQTPDSHRIRTIRYSTVRYRPPPPDLIGLGLLLFVRVTRHLVHPWGARNAMPCSRTLPSRSGKPQTRKHHVYHYHLAVNIPLNLPGMEGHLFQSGLQVWGCPQDD